MAPPTGSANDNPHNSAEMLSLQEKEIEMLEERIAELKKHQIDLTFTQAPNAEKMGRDATAKRKDYTKKQTGRV